MKYFASFALAGALIVAVPAASAQAATFSVNFCPASDTCNGVTAATLTFFERLDTTDVNDYFLDLTLVGGPSAPDFVDIVSFKIDDVSSVDGYEVIPSLLTSPTGATWQTYFDNVGGNAAACTSNTGQQHAVCSNGSDPGVALGTASLTWRYDVDLAGSFMLAAGSAVNLRASFIDAELVSKVVGKGKKSTTTWETVYKNGGILSPGGGRLQCIANCAPPPPDEPPTVPEPTTLALLGVGLLGAGVARRRR